jgi:hypothetical protein
VKYLMSLQTRDGYGAYDSETDSAIDADAAIDPTPSIEELVGAESVRSTGHIDRWLGLAIALATAVIGFGFVGGTLGPLPPCAATIGSTSEPSPRAVAAPRSPGPPLATVGAAATETFARGVDLAYVATELPGGALEISVDGHAPSTFSVVLIEIRSASGRPLESAEVPVTTDDERPGSDGRARVGVGSFHQRIVVPGPVPTDGRQVEVTVRKGPGRLSVQGPAWSPNRSRRE